MTGGHPERTAPPYPGGDPWADHRRFGTFDFTRLPDLAARHLGGAVTAASDESFAPRENLLRAERPEFTPDRFGPKGQLMDGWETRRRRGTGPDRPLPGPDAHDWALIRLGAPGVLRGAVVDTAHFRGNFAPAVTLEGTAADGHPAPADLLRDADWTPLLPRTDLHGHAAHGFPLDSGRYVTHLRLAQYPDGGIARLRAHGEPLPDPRWLDALGVFDTAALLNGGRVAESSDGFYSAADRMLHPGLARHQADGWETARRRADGTGRGGEHEWAVVRPAAACTLTALEIDTAHLSGNAPGWAAVRGDAGDGAWFPVLQPVPLRPDTPHRFALDAPTRPLVRLRLEIMPCGGVSRFRAHGRLTPDGRAALAARWTAARAAR